MKSMVVYAAVAAVLLALPAGGVAAPSAAPAASTAPSLRPASALATQVTEEGQTVVYDAYTWQRRELAKRLPLNEPWPSEAVIAAQFKRFQLDKPPLPASIPTPARILQDVYLVNSEPNLTYLIDAGPAGLVLIDPGLTSNVEPILKNVEALGFSRGNIKWVINTHAHFDHSMADAAFQKLGAKILVGRDDAPAVEKATEVTAKYFFGTAQAANYPTLHVDWPVDDGEDLVLGNKTFIAIHTPGHTQGSTCYFLNVGGKNVLFGGDTILFDYRLGAQFPPYADNVAYGASLRKLTQFVADYPLKKVTWDVLLPGHGTMVLDRAYVDVMKGMRQVQLDLIDGSPVDALPFGDDYYRKLMFGRP